MKKYLTMTVMLVVMLALLTTSAQVAAQEQEMDPESVIRAILGALDAGDAETAVSYAAADAVIVLLPPALGGEDNVVQGKEAIDNWWGFIAADNSHHELWDFHVDGNKVTWKATIWGDYFRNLGMKAPLEADCVGLVEDGLLQSYTWKATDESMARLAAAQALAANKEIVRRYIEAWEQADLTTLEELIAEDFVNHSPPLPPDHEGMLEFATEHRSQFPTGEYTIQNLVAEGDVVFVYGHYQGTHDGEPFMGIPASGAEASFDFSLLLRLADGKLVERWATSDDVMGLLVPLGFELVPPQ
jgi:predicted ester cyclase